MVPPSLYADEELRNVKSATLLLIGREESLYDPVPALTRANRLIPNFEGELISHASHGLPVSLPAVVNQRVLAFIAAASGFETERARHLQPA
jgi:pimeloyl-ACP methyl ester carboxylesterase